MQALGLLLAALLAAASFPAARAANFETSAWVAVVVESFGRATASEAAAAAAAQQQPPLPVQLPAQPWPTMQLLHPLSTTLLHAATVEGELKVTSNWNGGFCGELV